jgi:hypothetical protein
MLKKIKVFYLSSAKILMKMYKYSLSFFLLDKNPGFVIPPILLGHLKRDYLCIIVPGQLVETIQYKLGTVVHVRL